MRPGICCLRNTNFSSIDRHSFWCGGQKPFRSAQLSVQRCISQSCSCGALRVGQTGCSRSNITIQPQTILRLGKGVIKARGATTLAGIFFIENVFEELDYPGEFFYNESTGTCLYYNGTGMPPQTDIVVPNLQVLVNISGTQWEPVTDVTHCVKFVLRHTPTWNGMGSPLLAIGRWIDLAPYICKGQRV